MKEVILSVFILFQSGVFAQTLNQKDNYSVRIIEINGDLNNDGIDDKVLVTQDTIHEKSPYKIQIFYAEPYGKFKLIVSSTKLIKAQYPEGKNAYKSGNGFSDITIKNGVLSINNELLRGHFEHKFKFQNGNFELIGFSKVSSNGNGEMETVDFNLKTGIRIEEIVNYETNKVLSKIKKKILLSPLPKFQEIEPLKNALY